MDFHEQRTQDLIRAEARAHAIGVGRKTRELLGRYVSSRRLQVSGGSEIRIRWGRVLAAGLVLVGLAFALARAVR